MNPKEVIKKIAKINYVKYTTSLNSPCSYTTEAVRKSNTKFTVTEDLTGTTTVMTEKELVKDIKECMKWPNEITKLQLKRTEKCMMCGVEAEKLPRYGPFGPGGNAVIVCGKHLQQLEADNLENFLRRH